MFSFSNFVAFLLSFHLPLFFIFTFFTIISSHPQEIFYPHSIPPFRTANYQTDRDRYYSYSTALQISFLPSCTHPHTRWALLLVILTILIFLLLHFLVLKLCLDMEMLIRTFAHVNTNIYIHIYLEIGMDKNIDVNIHTRTNTVLCFSSTPIPPSSLHPHHTIHLH